MSNLISFAEAFAKIGFGRTNAYAARGDLLTEPIMVGNKAKLPAAEVEALSRARIAGFTKEETRELVKQLMEARQALATDEQIDAIVRGLQAKRLARGIPSEAEAQAARSEAGKRLVARRRVEKASA